MAEAAGLKKIESLKFGGFSDDEISNWRVKTSAALESGGFSPQEIKDYFGDKEPDQSGIKEYVNTNLQKAAAEKSKEGTPEGGPKVAGNFLDAFLSGLQISTAGLAIRGENPDVIMPEHSDLAMRIASQAGTLLGDVPAMALGGFLGATAGAPVGGAVGTAVLPGIGTLGGIGVGLTVGGGAGAFAAPAAMRKMLMDYYDGGHDFKDFWASLSSASWEALKQGVVGATTFGVGKAVGVGAKALGASEGLQTFSQISSEIGTMTTVGAAVEGHMPKAEDFITAAILVGGVHGLTHASGKLRDIYVRTGVRPGELVEMAKTDPILKQEILSDTKPEIGGEKLTVEIDGEKLSFPEDKVKIETEKPKLFREDIPRTDAELKVLERIGEQVVTKEKVVDLGKVTTALLDDLHPLKEIVKEVAEKPEAAKDPYILSRLYRGWHGKLERVLKFNTFDFATGKKVTGESLGAVLKDIPNGDKDGFTAFAMSKRAIEKEAQGVKTGIDLTAANDVVSKGKAFEKPFNRLVEFQNRMLDYAIESGLVNKDQAKAMRELNKDYIPFHRVQDLDPLSDSSGSKALFKKMFGSEKQILDPIASVVKNTEAILRASERNRVYKEFVDTVEKLPDGGDIVRKSERQLKPIEIKDKEINAFLKKMGVDEATVNESMTVFRGKDHIFKDNEFILYKDGKAEVYETTPELSKALKALDISSGLTNMWADIFLRLPANVLRMGVTMTPDFVLRNLFRDQLTTGIQSKYGQIPFTDVLQSIGHMWKKDEVWQNYLSSGGASGSFGEVARYIESDVYGLNKKTGFLDSVHNVIKTPFEALGVMSQAIEQLPRFTEFRKGGQTVEAAFSSREVSVDFAKAGAKIRAINAIVPFMNVGVQGMDRMARQFKEHPYQTMANATAMITMPTVLLWWANKDDSRYKDAPNWQKDLFWIIPTDKWEKAKTAAEAFQRPADLRRKLPDGTWEINNGTVYRLPKPFEYGILFGSTVERGLDGLYRKDGEKAFKDFTETIVQAAMPNIIPTTLAPMVEQRFNESFFTNRPIVPYHLEQVLPEYQYTEYTSETAKALSKLISTVPGVRDWGPESAKLSSPMVIDNYIRNWTGSLGQYALQIADKGLTATGIAKTKAEKPVSTLADIPFVKAFVMRHPSNGVQSIQDFYDNYEKTQEIRTTIKKLAKAGDFDAAMDLADDPEGIANLEGFKKALSNHNIMIQKINESDKYTPTEKRQLIDGMYYQMSQIATQGNDLLKSLKKQKLGKEK